MSLRTIAAKAYLSSKGAASTKHVKDGSLLDHLGRVEETLKSWDVPEHVQLAGLFHSVYGTSIFKSKTLQEKDDEQVKLLIGDDAFRLVTVFSRMKRSSLSSLRTPEKWSCTDNTSGEIIEITQDEASGLLHILLANAVDHLTSTMFDDAMVEINHYVPFINLLTPKAASFLQKLDRGTHQSEVPAPGLRFIGHAGVWLKGQGGSLVVDPWLYSSTFENPVLRGLQPYQRTIDFLIPRPVYSAEDISPDIILFSHFHTHHAPMASLAQFAKMKPVRVICPALSERDIAWIRSGVGDEAFANITFEASDEAREFSFGDLTIRAFTHPQLHHLGYEVKAPEGHFVHITDACVNTNRQLTTLDPMWNKVRDIHPDMLFISAANHLSRWGEGAERTIWEHSSLSPTQAAKISVLIGAKRVGLIGMDNFSIWDSALEYAHAAEAIENEFQWALEYLGPSIEFLPLRPGKKIL